MKKNLGSLLLAQLIFLGLLVTSLPQATQAEGFANPAFQNTWKRTDGPVAAGSVARPYFWGSEPFATKTERYDTSPSQKRVVQYFDKGRMEITYPDGDKANPWYVSSGLLVRDLAGGIVQVGDNRVQIFDPAEIAIVGDDQKPLATTPYYRDFLREALLGSFFRSRLGEDVTSTVRRGGGRGTRAASAQPKVKIGYYDSTSHHNIAVPFWDFMNSSGTVFNPAGQSVSGTVFEWQYILGYPMTEPLWTTASIGGKSQEVLIQLFQRRVLVYNPAAAPGSQVDFTNVGRHAYNWQYSPAATPQGDLSVPPSVNGTIRPSYGNLDTIFRVSAPGFKPGEKVAPTITQPDGGVLSDKDLNILTADPTGTLYVSFFGGDVATDTNQGLGVYRLDLKGLENGRAASLYWRIIERIPLTPTTPYKVDNSPPPPSIGAIVEPQVGKPGTTFLAFVFNFQAKDLYFERIAAWATSPSGEAFAISNQALVNLADEALDGMTLVLPGPTEPGIWAITLVYKNKPDKPAIIYLKITEAPEEATLGGALRIFTSGTRDSVGSLWAKNLVWQNRKPVPAPEQIGDE